MSLKELIHQKITNHHPKNGLDHVAKFFISLLSINHKKVVEHVERVALLSEVVAQKIDSDSKAAFFAGLLHDIGKLTLPSGLFHGQDISDDEYSQIKKHAVLGFDILKESYLFTGLCAGFHHAMYDHGYGLTMEDFPEDYSPEMIEMVVQIATIVSISDYIEAFTHRGGKPKHGPANRGKDLKDLLYDKYPKDIQIVDIALGEFENVEYWNSSS